MTLHVSDRVAAALDARRPVVALESTVVTHGLPYPRNLTLARDLEAAVRDDGAEPATIGVVDGRLVVGLDDAELVRLAEAGRAPASGADDGAPTDAPRAPASGVDKASLWNLAGLVAQGRSAGTTVAATLHIAARAGIEVFATGGIGGVHPALTSAERAAPTSAAVRDESADLGALARAPLAVISAGPKSLLDAAATLERLETLGVPVVGYRSRRLAGFLTEPLELDLPIIADTPRDIATILRTHVALGRPGGLLVSQPVTDPLPRERFEAWLGGAQEAAAAAGVRGKALTPFLLRELARRSGGATIQVNLSLLESNARLAARVAAELASLPRRAAGTSAQRHAASRTNVGIPT